VALTKVGKEGVTGISNSSNATAITIDSSEKVGIGTASPPDNLSVVTSGSNAQLSVDRSDGGAGRTVLIHSSTGGQLQTTGSVPLLLGTSDTERMRVDAAGQIMMHKSSLSVTTAGHEFRNTGVAIHSVNNNTCMELVRFGGTGRLQEFYSTSTLVGSISTDGSSTAYNTSSDYRLKENVTYDWDATTRLKQLKPARFNFIVNADVTVDGFLAHEAQAVVPESVTGTKDEVDDDDNAVMQGIDQSKIVPLLVKSLQEAITKIETLETKVQALEDA